MDGAEGSEEEGREERLEGESRKSSEYKKAIGVRNSIEGR